MYENVGIFGNQNVSNKSICKGDCGIKTLLFTKAQNIFLHHFCTYMKVLTYFGELFITMCHTFPSICDSVFYVAKIFTTIVSTRPHT